MPQLHLYDQQDNPLRRRGFAAVYCDDYRLWQGRCVTNRQGVQAVGVSSIGDVQREIQTHGANLKLITSLSLHTHGLPGTVFLRKGSITSANVGTLMQACAANLSAPADIFFYGCQVGQGSAGEKFLEDAGRAMLSHGGGRALAVNSLTWSVPTYGQWLPPWGSVVVAEVQVGGAVTIHHP